MPQAFVMPEFLTITMGIAVFLKGSFLTRQCAVLRNFNIPEPVTGGLLAAFVFWGVSSALQIDLSFETQGRDIFLVLFFASIGLSARVSDLLAGGKPLLLLLILTITLIVAQNVVGVFGATVFGFPPQSGVLFGSAALIGGHGTAIAWSPEVAAVTGMDGAAELGVAVATIGLILAALIGGPIAKYLVARDSLAPERPDEDHTVGLPNDESTAPGLITHITLMRVVLVLNLCVIGGFFLSQLIEETGLRLPLFVPCLIVGIVIGNALSALMPNAPPIARSPTLAVVSEFTLGVFLAISLMTLDFSALAGLGLPLTTILAAQTIFAVIFVVYVLFPVLGRGYRAAVLAAGFGGFALGATPTAIANMTAVTKRYGPSPMAFVVLPLVSAFFVDIANAFVIQTIVGF